MTENQMKYINKRHLELFSSLDDEKMCELQVNPKNNKMVVTPIGNTTIRANKIEDIGRKDPYLITKSTNIQFTSNGYQVVLFFDSLDKHQKVISFKRM